MPAAKQQIRPEATEVAIFIRLWDAAKPTPEVARHMLSVKFSDADVARMHELAARNREGQITPAELDEFDNYLVVGDLLTILHSKARMILKVKPRTRPHAG
jgi:hypothetical protein